MQDAPHTPDYPEEGWSKAHMPVGDIPGFLQKVGAPEGLTFELLAEISEEGKMAKYQSIEEFCLADYAGEISELRDAGRLPPRA